MGKRLTLILGGARSGKSTLAQSLAEQTGGRVLFTATAAALDNEMATRIAIHQASRPAGWSTLEAQTCVGQAVQSWPEPVDFVLLDCITLLVSNLMVALPEDLPATRAHQAVTDEIGALLSAYAAGSAEWVIVSNEVGLGLVPPYPLGRLYRDELGYANQCLAKAADRVALLVAGLPLWLKGAGD